MMLPLSHLRLLSFRSGTGGALKSNRRCRKARTRESPWRVARSRTSQMLNWTPERGVGVRNFTAGVQGVNTQAAIDFPVARTARRDLETLPVRDFG